MGSLTQSELHGVISEKLGEGKDLGKKTKSALRGRRRRSGALHKGERGTLERSDKKKEGEDLKNVKILKKGVQTRRDLVEKGKIRRKKKSCKRGILTKERKRCPGNGELKEEG